MTKRELIAKNDVFELIEEVENISWVNCFKTGVDTLPTITEEEIVKPYLEKLKTEIAGLKRFELRGAVTPLVNANRVIELIDNLLTEKGAEE